MADVNQLIVDQLFKNQSVLCCLLLSHKAQNNVAATVLINVSCQEAQISLLMNATMTVIGLKEEGKECAQPRVFPGSEWAFIKRGSGGPPTGHFEHQRLHFQHQSDTFLGTTLF